MRIVNAAVITGKRVLVRLDLDVPINDQWQIEDATRIDAAHPTLLLLKQHAKQVIICGHRGRPNGKIDSGLRLKPLIPDLEELIGQPVAFINTLPNEVPQSTPFSLLENLRFWPGEEQNDPHFATSLARLADIYIDEAFGVSHRTAASTVGITALLPSFAGFHFAKEVVELSTILPNPIQPFVLVLGGAKLETKLPLLETMTDTANAILVGGLLAKEINENNQAMPTNVIVASLTDIAKDIDQASIDRFTTIISKAQTIGWNGPLGKFEEPEGAHATQVVAQAIADSGAYTVVGGGDTLAALHDFGLLDKFDFVSVGGGAMLEFLSGQPLPALEALS